MSKIRILLADDHEIVRKGLRELINQQSDMEVIGEASDGREAVIKTQQYLPDVVLMDVIMPDVNGFEATREIRSKLPDIRIIALSLHANRSYVIQMFKEGALGYLLKDSAFNELISAIHKVVNNRIHLSHLLIKGIYFEFKNLKRTNENSKMKVLDEKEQMVLEKLSDQTSLQETGEILHISIEEVESVLEDILNKWMILENNE